MQDKNSGVSERATESNRGIPEAGAREARVPEQYQIVTIEEFRLLVAPTKYPFEGKWTKGIEKDARRLIEALLNSASCAIRYSAFLSAYDTEGRNSSPQLCAEANRYAQQYLPRRDSESSEKARPYAAFVRDVCVNGTEADPLIFLVWRNYPLNAPPIKRIDRNELRRLGALVSRDSVASSKTFSIAAPKNSQTLRDVIPENAAQSELTIEAIEDVESTAFSEAMYLHQKRFDLADCAPPSYFTRILRLEARRSTWIDHLLVAKLRGAVVGTMLLTYNRVEGVGLLSYAASRRGYMDQRQFLTTQLAKHVYRTLKTDERFVNHKALLVEMADPRLAKDAASHRNATARIRLFNSAVGVACSSEWSLRVVDTAYALPHVICPVDSRVGGEKRALLLQLSPWTKSKASKSEVEGMLHFLWTKLYASDFSEDEQLNETYLRYMNRLFDLFKKKVPEEVRLVRCEQFESELRFKKKPSPKKGRAAGKIPGRRR